MGRITKKPSRPKPQAPGKIRERVGEAADKARERAEEAARQAAAGACAAGFAEVLERAGRSAGRVKELEQEARQRITAGQQEELEQAVGQILQEYDSEIEWLLEAGHRLSSNTRAELEALADPERICSESPARSQQRCNALLGPDLTARQSSLERHGGRAITIGRQLDAACAVGAQGGFGYALDLRDPIDGSGHYAFVGGMMMSDTAVEVYGQVGFWLRRPLGDMQGPYTGAGVGASAELAGAPIGGGLDLFFNPPESSADFVFPPPGKHVDPLKALDSLSRRFQGAVLSVGLSASVLPVDVAFSLGYAWTFRFLPVRNGRP